MLSRWYALFIGFLLLILGIAGLVAPRVLGGSAGSLGTYSVIWLLTAIVALYYGFGVRNLVSLRRFAGVVGGLYVLWAIASMITAGTLVSPIFVVLSMVTLLVGTLGLAAALTPAYWLHEPETTYAPGRA